MPKQIGVVLTVSHEYRVEGIADDPSGLGDVAKGA